MSGDGLKMGAETQCRVCDVVRHSDFEVPGRFSVHQSRPEDITLREDCRAAPFVADDGFGAFFA